MSTDEPKTAGKIILAELAAMEKRIMAALDDLQHHLVELRRVAISAPAAGAPSVASDADLDGQYGNPEVKKNPPRWTKDGHESFMGRKLSECPPAFLDEMAGFCDWKAGRDDEASRTATDKASRLAGDERTAEEKVASDKAKYARYARTDAARARGWAARLRAGWKPPATDAGKNPEGW